MRLTITTIILFISGICHGQEQQKCKSTIDIGIVVNPKPDSLRTGTYCPRSGILAENKDFIIKSFIVSAGGEGFDGDIKEAYCSGNTFSPLAQQLITLLRKGSFVEIYCIKAEYKGKIYMLKPLSLEL